MASWWHEQGRLQVCWEAPFLILARRLGGLTLGVSGLGLAMGVSASGPLRYGRETYRCTSVTPTAFRMYIKYVCPPSICWYRRMNDSLFIAHVDENKTQASLERKISSFVSGKSCDGADKATLWLSASGRRVTEGA